MKIELELTLKELCELQNEQNVSFYIPDDNIALKRLQAVFGISPINDFKKLVTALFLAAPVYDMDENGELYTKGSEEEIYQDILLLALTKEQQKVIKEKNKIKE